MFEFNIQRILDSLNSNSGAWQAISTIVLVAITAFYAWQTKQTVQEIQQQTKVQQTPILKITAHPTQWGTFVFKNIGKGAALNTELRITQIHRTGGLTNLRNFDEDVWRELFSLGEGEEKAEAPTFATLFDYQSGEKKDFAYGVKNVFAIIATYEDINRNPFYTISLFKVISGNMARNYLLKTTRTGDFKSGEIEKVNEIDWLK